LLQKDYGLKADGIVGNQSLTVLKTMSSVKDAPDYVKASAKASTNNVKTGDIKNDTILMSTQTTKKVADNVSKVQKASGGGSVQYEVQNNKVVITGVTVTSKDTKGAEVKVTPGKAIQADSDKGVAKLTSTVTNVSKSLDKLTEGTKVSSSANSSNNKTTGTKNSSKTTTTVKSEYTISALPDDYVPSTQPDHPQLGPGAAVALGFDSGTGGFVLGVINGVNTVLGKPGITQEVIDYNIENTPDFEERYKAGEVLGTGALVYTAVAGGAKKAIVKDTTKGSDNLFSNGKLDVNNTEALKQTFKRKTTNEIADILRAEVYDVTIKNSTRSSSGAQIITINNKGEGRNIM